MKSDYALAASTVYNTFPFPLLTENQFIELRKSGKAILDTRREYPNETLGNLYDPVLMPPKLLKQHKSLDKLVLNIYGIRSDASENEILETLIQKYSELTADQQIGLSN
jgi:hypothetical protein